jgi:hypothetical protein
MTDNNEELYVQPTISVRLAQYLLKSLDYMHIHAQQTDNPSIIEPELHAEGEDAMTDIVLDAPLPEDN